VIVTVAQQVVDLATRHQAQVNFSTAAWTTSRAAPSSFTFQHRGIRPMTCTRPTFNPDLDRSRRRDSDLLRALHDEHADALSSYVVGLTGGHRDKAQDIVQETLLRAWRNPAVLEHVGGSARGWLFTVAKHIVIDDWRSASRRPRVVTDQLPEQTVQDMGQQIVDREVVMAALRKLSTEHQQVVFECYFRDASVAEAAKTLGVPRGTIKSRTHYALHALRRELDGIATVTRAR
jgi:RNA polymerase sigma-70 factor (ECF subfamily)